MFDRQVSTDYIFSLPNTGMVAQSVMDMTFDENDDFDEQGVC